MSLGTTPLASAVDPLEILLECESKCLCADDAKASFGGRGADPAGGMFHQLTCTGMFPPPGEKTDPAPSPAFAPRGDPCLPGLQRHVQTSVSKRHQITVSSSHVWHQRSKSSLRKNR